MEVGGLTNFYFNLWVRPTFFYLLGSFLLNLLGFLCVIRVSKRIKVFFFCHKIGSCGSILSLDSIVPPGIEVLLSTYLSSIMYPVSFMISVHKASK